MLRNLTPRQLGMAAALRVGAAAAAWRPALVRSLCAASAAPGPAVPLVQVFPDQAGASRRETELFPAAHDALPPVEDHGLKYFTSPAELEGRDGMVQRALSTRTATVREMRTFRKAQLVAKFRTHEHDTGSGRVQGECTPPSARGWGVGARRACCAVALLTERIAGMTAHMAGNPKDTASKRVLSSLVATRRKVLRHMLRTDYTAYRVVLKELGLKAVPFRVDKYAATDKTVKKSHAELRARNARVKKRSSRGAKGH